MQHKQQQQNFMGWMGWCLYKLYIALYANVLVLLLISCLVVYFVELDLKLGFIKQQQLVMTHAYPFQGSSFTKAVVIYGVVVGAWLMCEVGVMFLSPLECNANGLLVKA